MRARRTAVLPRVLMNIFFHSTAPWPTFQTEQRRRALVEAMGEQSPAFRYAVARKIIKKKETGRIGERGIRKVEKDEGGGAEEKGYK